MLLRLLFILNIFTFITLNTAEAARTCYYGGYNYKGHFYSDSYSLLPRMDVSSCKANELNEALIGNEYEKNREKIDELAEKILKEKSCDEAKSIVSAFLEKREHIHRGIDINSKTRVNALMEALKGENVQIQSDFALAGHYNAACSNEDHRALSMMNAYFIDQMLAQKVEPPVTQVTKEKVQVDDCRNVVASGSDHLQAFTVSMKKGTGKKFLFSWSPFGVPDRVTVTNANNKVLFDSGCSGGNQHQELKTFSLEAPQESILTINVQNNCDELYKESQSSWMLRLKCESTKENECKTQLTALADLLKKENEILKKILTHYEYERHCYLSYGEEIWADLMNRGYIMLDSSALAMGLCPPDDKVCEQLYADPPDKDIRAPASVKSPELPFDCGPKPPGGGSLFERISYSYCSVGRKRLGL